MGTCLVVKWIHVTAAFVSVGGFVLRGVWMLENSPLFSRRWVRIAPHVVDTVLLASAIALAASIIGLLRSYWRCLPTSDSA